MAERGDGPDFIGIGVQKSGTSWINSILWQHPDVLIRKKEIRYYDRYFHRGERWYHDWFQGRGDRVAGEISPSYIFSPPTGIARKLHYPRWNPRHELRFWRKLPCAREEIHRRYPDARIFAIFRNPVERAWSHYWMWVRRRKQLGQERLIVPFARMFRDDGRWIRSQGHHASLLSPWLERFPDMGVFLFDDLLARPLELARDVYRTIGVDDSVAPKLDKANPGSYGEAMSAEDRHMAVEYYREEVERFSRLIGRDLDHWLRSEARGAH